MIYSDGRQLLLAENLYCIQRILGMMDRNPYSPTYGCCDRNYWHYRITDHPSGIFQHSVLALALAATCDVPGNRFYGKPRMRELAAAGMSFTKQMTRRDGSADDYYPFERAFGAIAFPLVGSTEAYQLLQLEDTRLLDSFVQQAQWLVSHDEPYLLANHQALAILSLFNVGRITRKRQFTKAAEERLRRIFTLQSQEGWYREYEGCDPGYHTLTMAFLGRLYQYLPDPDLCRSLVQAAQCAACFLHPDGSYGGEYGSRNYSLFLMHGFEVIANKIPLATSIVNHYLNGMKQNKQVVQSDSRNVFLIAADRIQALRDFCSQRSNKDIKEIEIDKTTYLQDARIMIVKRNPYYLITSTAKGGTFKAFARTELLFADCGLIGRLTNGQVVVTQLVQDTAVHISEGSVSITGHWHTVNHPIATPWRTLFFRIILLTLGRSSRFCRWLKRLLTNSLVLHKKLVPIRFKRELQVTEKGIQVRDTILLDDHRFRFAALHAGTDHTSIYVTGSRYFQESVLHSWANFSEYLEDLNKNGSVTIERLYS